MNDLIEALQIFSKYTNNYKYPTSCDHDVLIVSAPKEISDEDIKRLEELSFEWSDSYDNWYSTRFGSF